MGTFGSRPLHHACIVLLAIINLPLLLFIFCFAADGDENTADRIFTMLMAGVAIRYAVKPAVQMISISRSIKSLGPDMLVKWTEEFNETGAPGPCEDATQNDEQIPPEVNNQCPREGEQGSFELKSDIPDGVTKQGQEKLKKGSKKAKEKMNKDMQSNLANKGETGKEEDEDKKGKKDNKENTEHIGKEKDEDKKGNKDNKENKEKKDTKTQKEKMEKTKKKEKKEKKDKEKHKDKQEKKEDKETKVKTHDLPSSSSSDSEPERVGAPDPAAAVKMGSKAGATAKIKKAGEENQGAKAKAKKNGPKNNKVGEKDQDIKDKAKEKTTATAAHEAKKSGPKPPQGNGQVKVNMAKTVGRDVKKSGPEPPEGNGQAKVKTTNTIGEAEEG